MLEAVDSLDLSTHVEFAGGLVEVGHGRVLLVASEDLLSLELPIGKDVISG